MTNDPLPQDHPFWMKRMLERLTAMEIILPEQGPTFVLDETVVDYRGELLGNKLKRAY